VQVLDPPRRRLLLIADAKPLFAALREDCDAPPVRRPLGGPGLAVELGQLPRFAPGEREQPRLRLPRPPGNEDERLPVRREARAEIAVAGRDLLGTSAGERHAPEPRLVRAVLDRPSPVDNRRAVGSDRELGQKRLAEQVLRSESARRHRRILNSVRRSRYSPRRPEPL